MVCPRCKGKYVLDCASWNGIKHGPNSIDSSLLSDIFVYEGHLESSKHGLVLTKLTINQKATLFCNTSRVAIPVESCNKQSKIQVNKTCKKTCSMLQEVVQWLNIFNVHIWVYSRNKFPATTSPPGKKPEIKNSFWKKTLETVSIG